MELDILELWKAEGAGRFQSASGKPLFAIDTPPPYASGRWHVGGAVHYAQIDSIARYKRMKGFEVLFAFGVDRNGLPVEIEVEKRHRLKAHEMPRERFLELCRAFLDEVESQILSIARRLGLSAELDRPYRTDSPEYRQLTQATFIRLWQDGLIYEDDRPSNWCTVCGTTIADAEIEYENRPTKLCYVRFPVREGGEVAIATTRPELLCSCALVIYHPQDERYRDLEGKHAVVPLYGFEVPIRPHPYAKPEFGTGAAMICSFGDYTDVRLFRELDLKPKVAIATDGRMNSEAGDLKGLTVEEAREKTISLLQSRGLLIKVETITHSTPICWRSKNPIEFIAVPEYYLKQLPYLEDLKSAVEGIEFHPPEAKQLLLDWISAVKADWPVSRRRFYGTEIPLWRCEDCGRVHVPPPGRYYQPWREEPPLERCGCGSKRLVGETRVFDTWMDSSISQLFILGLGRDEELFRRGFPCGLRPQGLDIVRTWLYYSLLRTYQLLRAPAFRHVRISGMGLDERGEAMHKSKGNVVWPEPLLEKYGADALRLWGAAEARLGSNYRFSPERLEGAFRFITKLWNVSRFISAFDPAPEGYALQPLDRLALSELNGLIRESEASYEQMDLFPAAQAIRRFVWGFLADHYVEAVKARAYNFDGAFSVEAQRGAWFTLHACLSSVLRLLAPICPFVTDALWRRLYGGESVHSTRFPSPNPEWDSELGSLTPLLTAFNSAIWRFKKSRNLSLNAQLSEVAAPEALQPLAPDLRAMHRIGLMRFGKPPEEAGQFELVEGVYVKA